MPQMSPLMWGIMFSIFSILMILSFIKTYFNYFSEMNPSTNNCSTASSYSVLTWTW